MMSESAMTGNLDLYRLGIGHGTWFSHGYANSFDARIEGEAEIRDFAGESFDEGIALRRRAASGADGLGKSVIVDGVREGIARRGAGKVKAKLNVRDGGTWSNLFLGVDAEEDG